MVNKEKDGSYIMALDNSNSMLITLRKGNFVCRGNGSQRIMKISLKINTKEY